MYLKRLWVIIFIQLILFIGVVSFIFSLDTTFDTQLMFLSLFLVIEVFAWTKIQSFFQKDAIRFQHNKLETLKNPPIEYETVWSEALFKSYFLLEKFEFMSYEKLYVSYRALKIVDGKKVKKPVLELYLWLLHPDGLNDLEHVVRTIEKSYQTKGSVIKNITITIFEPCKDTSCENISSQFTFEKTSNYFLTVIPVGVNLEEKAFHVLHSNTYTPSIFFKQVIDRLYHMKEVRS
jgi:hypothetical protein